MIYRVPEVPGGEQVADAIVQGALVGSVAGRLPEGTDLGIRPVFIDSPSLTEQEVAVGVGLANNLSTFEIIESLGEPIERQWVVNKTLRAAKRKLHIDDTDRHTHPLLVSRLYDLGLVIPDEDCDAAASPPELRMQSLLVLGMLASGLGQYQAAYALNWTTWHMQNAAAAVREDLSIGSTATMAHATSRAYELNIFRPVWGRRIASPEPLMHGLRKVIVQLRKESEAATVL